ncbi:MAG: hypothetical protein HYZ14_18840, partial [Bacteroidetes bacterium]|nr:hypothetical protein [Bacteroidota bacterium]
LIYYPFNGNGNDASGNGYHGDVHATLTADRFGNPNSAYHFNGIDEYIEFPLVAELKPGLPVSYSFWIKLEDTAPQKTVFVTNDFAQNNHSGVWMNMSSTGVLAINYGDASGATTGANLRNLKGYTLLTTGVWYHVVGVANGPADMQLYLDCVEEGYVYSGTGGDVQYTSAPGNIGRKDVAGVNPYYFQGTIDDFRYWNRALTQADVDFLCSEYAAVEAAPQIADITLFPTPLTGDLLTFSTNQTIQAVRILDLSGRLVFESAFNETINIGSIGTGLFVIEFYDQEGNRVGVKKFERL